MNRLSIDPLDPGVYVVAVSGGIDSVALLHAIAQNDDCKLIVTHVDHGWRSESPEDAAFVEKQAATLELPYIGVTLAPAGRDEASARRWRYAALERTANQFDASAVLTAHHADDVLETSLMNILRGTNRHGAAPKLGGGGGTKIIRPLLKATKAEIRKYANQHKLTWREDRSNQDTTYRRNRIRHHIVPSLNQREYCANLQSLVQSNPQLDSELDNIIDQKATITAQSAVTTVDKITFDRTWLAARSPALRRHVLARAMERLAPHEQLSQRLLIRLSHAIVTDSKHSRFPLGNALSATLLRDKLVLTRGVEAS